MRSRLLLGGNTTQELKEVHGYLQSNTYHRMGRCSLLELKSTKDMATALSCSPQFADFNHIAQAVGHHVLQHLIVFLAVCISQISREIAHQIDPI